MWPDWYKNCPHDQKNSIRNSKNTKNLSAVASTGAQSPFLSPTNGHRSRFPIRSYSRRSGDPPKSLNKYINIIYTVDGIYFANIYLPILFGFGGIFNQKLRFLVKITWFLSFSNKNDAESLCHFVKIPFLDPKRAKLDQNWRDKFVS